MTKHQLLNRIDELQAEVTRLNARKTTATETAQWLVETSEAMLAAAAMLLEGTPDPQPPKEITCPTP